MSKERQFILFILLFLLIGSSCFQFYVKYDVLAYVLSILSKISFFISFIIFISRRGFIKLLKSKVFVVILCFFIYLFYTTYFGALSYITLFPMLMKILGVIFIIHAHLSKNYRNIIKIVSSVFSTIVYLNFIQLIFFDGIMGSFDGNTVYLISSNYNQFGGILLPAIISSVLNYYNDRNLRKILNLLLISLLSVLLTGSLTSSVGILFFIMYFVVFRRVKLRKIVLRSYILAVLLFILFILSSKFLENRIININYMLEKMGKDITFSGRTNIWINAIAMIINKPFLGYGFFDGEWGHNYLNGYNAHNIFLQTLLQGGIVLFLIFNYLLFIVVKKIKKILGNQLSTSFFILFWTFILMSQLEVYNYTMIFILLYLFTIPQKQYSE